MTRLWLTRLSQLGDKIGFDWVCFLRGCEGVYFHNRLLMLYLRSFLAFFEIGFEIGFGWLLLG